MPTYVSTDVQQQTWAGPDGSQMGQSAADKVAFWGATPVVQPATPGANTHTVTAGSTTAVFVNSSFDGSLGTTAWTIGDIVAVLKTIGILAT